MGVLREYRDGTYANTARSEELRDVPGSMRPLTMLEMQEVMPAELAILDYMKGNKTWPFRASFGHDLWEHYRENPAAGANFDLSMQAIQTMSTPGLAADYPWHTLGGRTVCDVGGGQGGMLEIALLNAPQAKGILFDLPAVAERSERDAPWSDGVKQRIEFVGGSFFDSVPSADVYIIRLVLHDWSDDDTRRILRSIKQAIRPGGYILNVDVLLPEHGRFARSMSLKTVMDMQMLASTEGGRERSLSEFQQ
eukprot:TRINITY_DN2249_c0_g1_i2.p1 TRINITY_DN2249_c0_g1~~TRINITY_DN2249_c0_g1_i2.p1  ORF type:complete len:251 (-),score=85.38 TRINITY_DN2249_c0_g1_i2:205-957(-)